MASADMDGDGFIDWSDFKKFMSIREPQANAPSGGWAHPLISTISSVTSRDVTLFFLLQILHVHSYTYDHVLVRTSVLGRTLRR